MNHTHKLWPLVGQMWAVTMCSLADMYQHFGESCCLHLQSRNAILEDGDIMPLWNTSTYGTDYKISHHVTFLKTKFYTQHCKYPKFAKYLKVCTFYAHT